MEMFMECPKCQYVGQYEFDEIDTERLVLIKLVCANCGMVDKSVVFRQVDKSPRTLKQRLRTAKAILRALGKGYVEDGTAFIDTVRDEPMRLLSFAGWFMGMGIFIYCTVPIATGAILDPNYTAGRQELYNLAMGIVALAFGLFMLRKRWD